ncbi:MAG: serine acetyltransferase [Clostridia bacterium]|nr:serine acetyltransferase [Clostridia bacterium]
MIKSKKDLKEYIESDNAPYRPKGKKGRFIAAFSQQPTYAVGKYLKALRRLEYRLNTSNGSRLSRIMALICERKKNRLGNKLGIEICPNCIGKGVIIDHGLVLVNYEARIGENCRLHGSNCIGNSGKALAAPRIGNNVDIGYGAMVIGDVEIADNVVIGANAVVNKSVLIPGSLVAGVPAQRKG